MELIVLTSKPCSFGGVDLSSYEDIINISRFLGHTPIVISYFHGILEDTVGYDIGMCLNGELCSTEDKYIDGIYSVKVIGYDNPCTAFLWNHNEEPRGLIIDNNDIEAYKYAKSQYDKKVNNL